MKNPNPFTQFLNARCGQFALLLCSLAGPAVAATFPAKLDNFDAADLTTVGTPRLLVTDAQMGGQSAANPAYQEGILRMEGSLAPARGQPGFVSLVLLLDAQGKAQNLEPYSGIEIRIRVMEGSLSVLAASSQIQNFDFHATAIKRSADFQRLRIPFKVLKRMWSEPTKLDISTITSINFVASGVQNQRFLYEIDSVGFYTE